MLNVQPHEGENNTGTGQIGSQQTPAFVQDMNDILAGKYDNDREKLRQILGDAIKQVEVNVGNKSYSDLLMKAMKHITSLLSKLNAKRRISLFPVKVQCLSPVYLINCIL